MGREERLPYIGMVMRTKIKEIIASGAKFGMRGDLFFFPSGFGCWFVLFILILLVVDYCTTTSR